MSLKRSATSKPVRVVPPFGVESRQKNTVVKTYSSPSLSLNTKKSFKRGSSQSPQLDKKVKESISMIFRKTYERGNFPLVIQHNSRGNRVLWRTPLEELDIEYYLPIFFDGLIETHHPYQFLAEEGSVELVKTGDKRVLGSLPFLIQPLRKVLDTRRPEKVALVLRILQKLITNDEMAGEALIPYYRQLLPVIAYFRTKNVNIGDKIEWGQRKKRNLGDLIEETLQLMELRGGPHAHINIKYMIPTYQPCANYV